MQTNGWKRCSLTLVVAAGLSPRQAAAQFSQRCAATPELAAALQYGPTGSDGYVLVGKREDAAHGRRWALVAKCDTPEAPWKVIPLTGRVVPAKLREAVVHAGQTVLFHDRSANTEIALNGFAEQSGAEGERIHVRLPSVSAEATAPRRVTATIVGPGQVEGEL